MSLIRRRRWTPRCVESLPGSSSWRLSWTSRPRRWGCNWLRSPNMMLYRCSKPWISNAITVSIMRRCSTSCNELSIVSSRRVLWPSYAELGFWVVSLEPSGIQVHSHSRISSSWLRCGLRTSRGPTIWIGRSHRVRRLSWYRESRMISIIELCIWYSY